MSNASAVLVGMLVGRGDYPYARACVNKLIQIYAVIGVVCAALLLAVKGPVIGIYDIKESTRVLTDQLMYVYAAAIFFMAFTCPLISGVLRGAGDTRFAAVTDVGCIWAMVPLGAAAAFWLGAPPVLVLAVLKCDMPLKAFSVCAASRAATGSATSRGKGARGKYGERVARPPHIRADKRFFNRQSGRVFARPRFCAMMKKRPPAARRTPRRKKRRNAMNLFISSDIEGTCGIAAWSETEPGRPDGDYAYFKQQMSREVAAAAARSGGRRRAHSGKGRS